MSQDSIGALWPIMSGPTPIPTAQDRAADAAAIRRGLPEVRHKVLMRHERLFGVWRVTFADGSKVLRECRFQHDHTLEETIRHCRGFGCLADRQAVELGMRHGSGAITLQLDAEQYASLSQPL